MAEAIVYAVVQWCRATGQVQWCRVTQSATTMGLEVGSAQISTTTTVGEFLMDAPQPEHRPARVLVRNAVSGLLGLPRAAVAIVEVSRG